MRESSLDRPRNNLADRVLEGLTSIVEVTTHDKEANKLQYKFQDIALKKEKVPDRLMWKAIEKLKQYDMTEDEAAELARKVQKNQFTHEIRKTGTLEKIARGTGKLLFNKYTKYPLIFALGGIAGPTVGHLLKDTGAAAASVAGNTLDAVRGIEIPEEATINPREILQTGAVGAAGLGIGALGAGAITYSVVKGNMERRQLARTKDLRRRMRERRASREKASLPEANLPVVINGKEVFLPAEKVRQLENLFTTKKKRKKAKR